MKKVMKQFLKFGLIGVVATVTHVVFLYIFTEFFNLYYILSSLFAFAIAVTVSFGFNKIWTFGDRSPH